MASPGKFAPAFFWRALFILGAAFLRAYAATPVTAPPELAQTDRPSDAEVERILADFRQSGIVGDYYLEFELRTLPRRGEEKTFQGKIWGSRDADGKLTRVVLTDGSREQRLLVKNGPQSAVWRLTDKGVSQLEPAALFDPVVPGVNLTTFDLQMPFIYWPGVTFERTTRMVGRPAHAFLFKPPAPVAVANPSLGAVRAYLDTVYNIPSQVETLDRKGTITKTLSVIDLKRIGEQYIPKSFEVRDEVTRDKTRLIVRAAALKLSLPSSIFAPASLAEEVKPPAPERIQKIAP